MKRIKNVVLFAMIFGGYFVSAYHRDNIQEIQKDKKDVVERVDTKERFFTEEDFKKKVLQGKNGQNKNTSNHNKAQYRRARGARSSLNQRARE